MTAAIPAHQPPVRIVLPPALQLKITELQAAIDARDVEKIALTIVLVGVNNPENCDCTPADLKKRDPQNPWKWLHKNHRALNRLVYDMLPLNDYKLFLAIRAVFLKDKRELFTDNDGKEYEGWGPLFEHNYSDDILKYFLTTQKKGRLWI